MAAEARQCAGKSNFEKQRGTWETPAPPDNFLAESPRRKATRKRFGKALEVRLKPQSAALFSRAPSQEIFEYPARGKRCTASGGIIESAKLLNFLPAYSLPRMPCNRTFFKQPLAPEGGASSPARQRKKRRKIFFKARLTGKYAVPVDAPHAGAPFNKFGIFPQNATPSHGGRRKNSGRTCSETTRAKKFPLPFFGASQTIPNARGLQHFASLKCLIEKLQFKERIRIWNLT